MRDLATLDRQAVLLDSAEKVIALKNIALKRAELTIQAQDSSYRAKDNEAKELKLVIENERAIQKKELKKAKRKGNKKMVSGFILGSVFVLLIL